MRIVGLAPGDERVVLDGGMWVLTDSGDAAALATYRAAGGGPPAGVRDARVAVQPELVP